MKLKGSGNVEAHSNRLLFLEVNGRVRESTFHGIKYVHTLTVEQWIYKKLSISQDIISRHIAVPLCSNIQTNYKCPANSPLRRQRPLGLC